MMATVGRLLTRGIDTKTFFAFGFVFAFVPFTTGLASTLFREHGLLLTVVTNLPMALLCLVVLSWTVFPFTSWTKLEVLLLALTSFFTIEQMFAVHLNGIDTKAYQYPATLGIAMLAGVVAKRTVRQIRLVSFTRFLRKIVKFLVLFFCIEALVRFVYSPYVQRFMVSDEDIGTQILYRFKYSFFFMEANYVSMALLCLLAIMLSHRQFFAKHELVITYVLLACTFSRSAFVPAVAQFLFARWWRFRRPISVAVMLATIGGNVLAFSLYMSNPELFTDASFVSKLYAFGRAVGFMQDSGITQKLLGMGFGNSIYILGTPVHSLPATFLFEFGVAGTLLFVLYLALMAKESPACVYFLIIPFAIYGISIVGIATSSFLFTMGMLSPRPVHGGHRNRMGEHVLGCSD